MNEQEKVIEDLEAVVRDFHEETDEWGQFMPDELRGGITVDCDWYYGVMTKCEAALALLKAHRQEPRVMALKEALSADYAYLEIRIHKDIVCCILSFDEDGDIQPLKRGFSGILQADTYGKKWRCWTSRPTDEQREAEPWN